MGLHAIEVDETLYQYDFWYLDNNPIPEADESTQGFLFAELDQSGNPTYVLRQVLPSTDNNQGSFLFVNNSGDLEWGDVFPYTENNEGKVLTVGRYGDVQWEEFTSVPYADYGYEGQFLGVNNSGEAVWTHAIPDTYQNEGKALMVNGNGDAEWLHIDSVPDPYGYSEGSVLVIDSNGDPSWGSAFPDTTNFIPGTTFIIDDYGNPAWGGVAVPDPTNASGTVFVLDDSGHPEWGSVFPDTYGYEGYALVVDSSGNPVWEDIFPYVSEQGMVLTSTSDAGPEWSDITGINSGYTGNDEYAFLVCQSGDLTYKSVSDIRTILGIQ